MSGYNVKGSDDGAWPLELLGFWTLSIERSSEHEKTETNKTNSVALSSQANYTD
jgi:hypothetical protein